MAEKIKVTPVMLSRGKQLILEGLAGLVEYEGCTMTEAFEIVEQIKRDSWHALKELELSTDDRKD